MYPENLKYTEKHEWIDPDSGKLGITFYAQEQLGDIVFVELPDIGKKLEEDDVFGVIESVKSVSDCFSPVSGTVIEVNEKLSDEPALLNSSPYEEGWIIKIEIGDSNELNKLMGNVEYQKYLEEVK
ncbi:glycine cleavage system protein GcvH [bacterium]|nr:glycine cleavage system protein GcvH [bacterium]